jgi:MFS family permease
MTEVSPPEMQGILNAKVRGRWITLISLTTLGLYVGYCGPALVLLPNQAQAIAGTAHDIMALGWVTALGSVVAMITQPVVGALSDRTTSRLGRRHPWILGGAVIAALALALLAWQHTIAGMIVCWSLAQAGLNALESALTASVPDQVPIRQRGFASGWISLQQTLGAVVAVVLVSLVVIGNGGYTLIALIVLASATPFVFFTQSVRLTRENRSPFAWRNSIRSLPVNPRRHPDFAWAWVTRFLVMLGNQMAISYLLYFLRDKIRFQQLYPKYTAEDGLLLLVVIYTAGVVSSAVISGRISDRSGRRKPVVAFSGLTMAVTSATLALWPTWWAAVGCALFLGLGFGAYLAVDIALVTQVLPSAAGYAKDLGIINIATAGAQVLAPAIAAFIVSSLGGYPALYLSMAVIVGLGSVFIWKVRSVP